MGTISRNFTVQLATRCDIYLDSPRPLFDRCTDCLFHYLCNILHVPYNNLQQKSAIRKSKELHFPILVVAFNEVFGIRPYQMLLLKQ